MSILNIEFKAATTKSAILEERLLQFQPTFIGEDHQVDTYFNVPLGRLKLRQGNIENALIHYLRENISGSKSSHVLLYKHQPDNSLKDVLTEALGVKAVVDKTRRIYYIKNVKFHFDSVKELGNFVEVEAICTDGSVDKEMLQQQCDQFIKLFEINPGDFVAVSYSDLIIEKLKTGA